MYSFQYKHGDRPLEGYTIQRAAGRGGFGEVYYAVSDSGREVALKAVMGYEQIELRGISQCMNLKNPHLVTIFDVKYNDQGRPFVIMEYVAGPSLRQLLDDSPAGLGTQKTAFFLREIGKGLTFLHECGIVHRDLKPGNIFYENGYVKIGDYGLSKAISPTQHSGQTVTVGTVHYMAPEVGVGKYDRSIDIYALGACLYEMLTGTVPFLGASPSEILMKHLSAEPDVSGIPEPFATVIKKSMAKDPAQRYQSVQEMVEAVFGAEHVRMSVSHFSPDDLTMVAGRVAQKVHAAAGAEGSGGMGQDSPFFAGVVAGQRGGSSSVIGVGTPPKDHQRDVWSRFGDAMDRFGDRMNDVGNRIEQRWGRQSPQSAPAPIAEVPQTDPLERRTRRALAVVASIVVAVAGGFVGARHSEPGVAILTLFFVFAAVWGHTWGTLLAWQRVMPGLSHESAAVRRLIAGMVIAATTLGCASLLWLPLGTGHGGVPGSTWLAILIPAFFLNTQSWVRPDRRERLRFWAAGGAALFGFIVARIFDGNAAVTMAILAGSALMVQLLAPWIPNAAKSTKPRALVTSPPQPMPRNFDPFQSPPAPMAPAQSAAPIAPLGYSSRAFDPRRRPTPRWASIAWMIGVVIFVTLGLMLLIAAGALHWRSQEDVVLTAFGVPSLILAAFCLWRSFVRSYRSVWSYLFRPLLMVLMLGTGIGSAIVIGNMNRLRDDETMVGIFFIVFPFALFLSLLVGPRLLAAQDAQPAMPPGVSKYKRLWAALLTAPLLIGVGGIHRFYVGKIGSGIVWLLTCGMFGVGQIVDFILILSGRFKDAEGKLLLRWEDEDVVAPTPAPIAQPAPAFAPPVSPAAPGDPIAPMVNDATAAIRDSIEKVRTRIRERRGRRIGSGGPLAVVASLLIMVSFLLALGLATDVPSMLQAGLPDNTIAAKIQEQLGGYENWPHLMRSAGKAVCVLFMVLGIASMLFARRRAGFLHMFRGTIGAVGLVLATMPLSTVFLRYDLWPDIAQNINAKPRQIGAAIETAMSHFSPGLPYLAAGIFLASVILLSWPERRPAAVAKDR